MPEEKTDLFARGKKPSPEAAIHLADLIERLGQHPSQARIRQEFVRQIGIEKAGRVLDIGCGTGVLTREFPPLVGEMGHVIGSDPNYRLVETARKLAKEKGLSGRVSYCMGEAEVINFSADNAYHATVSSQLFSHVPDPERILYEMVRVTKPGGRLAILDYDFATLSSSHLDQETTGRLHRFLVGKYLVNPTGIRTLPPLCVEFGLEKIDLAAFAYLEREAEGPLTLILLDALGTAVSMGEIDAGAAARWREGLEKQGADGGYFMALTYFALYAFKPAI